LISGEGEVASLQVYRYVKTKTPTFRAKDLVSKTYDEADGVAWVPKHGHWLVISAGFDTALPQITLWAGKSKRVLRRGFLGRRAESEYVEKWFNLRSVSADGRFIIYDYFVFDTRGKDKVFRNLRMSLPRS